MIGRNDVIGVAHSIRMDISEQRIEYVLRNYESAGREDELWHETVENLLREKKQQEEMYAPNPLEQEEMYPPNPMDYEDSPEGDARYWDDYWGGDFDAMAYHDDIGDR